ncbi:protein kintoun isoform X1 [Salmo trutta]|uniref:Protein kintoun n=1 Tax=Salmo trutta TaxID=8032 RepID=A0A674A5G3_SALTR|nr:protein kintoun isoform X1 [Salmo trutta]XP_029586621.1 protein kintoun isoform X1 [Salmo trutta]XP_029586622.1 protein kintoun isoform X1 [Salmo trutta]XP_029586623.1 protein kintoun isoform X1 [Salmo trutta]XP_029586625.1 protein kintoun isoform X1 [Salmo trutta]XP_029586626.1 protein kintoun isoform X1 [Salmo trutta]XP_029586627.1 protein kintoun isoform X1 [Salmo trutta]XP_029586628.1 protein kintoun isoform X1 [Salmo trutta]XP_029586629.1 protein kintoun isoform X1 [Salmo trutta]
MEFGSKLKDLNMTSDEIGRFTKAFQNEEFRKMMHEYAEEISKPENKKKYEEEIKLLEQERGMDIQFVHPEPYRALKTSMDGRQKCFINVCSNDMIRKPEFRRVDEAGRVGQHWSLPHSLTPGTPDRDAKGNKYTIYDVVFHPDTIHMAGNNPRFMEMVDNTAVEAVENGGKVKLDKNNVRVLKIKYKGTPHAAVMRKPLPGQPAKEKPSPFDDHLSFPYPDEKQPDTATNQNESPKPKAEIQSDTQISQRQQKANSPKEPTKPHYTLKYRSFIDLQDFRCSRDSAQSPRPKEIVITIDLPLLRSVADADLDVTERLVSLESKKPAYRLEVPMAYPVDENKGEAKFNKQKKQLVVTLPVLPLKEPTIAQLSGRQLVNDDGEEDFENSCVSAAQSEDGTRGKEDTPDHSERGKEDTPDHSERGKEDTPDHSERGKEDTPDHSERGKEDTPDHSERGKEDTPNHSERGKEDTPDHSGCNEGDSSEACENAISLQSENQLISVLEDKIEFSEQSGDIEEDKQHKLRSGESHRAKASEPTEFDGKTGCTDQNEGQSDGNHLHDEVETDPSSLSERIDDPSNTAAMVIPSNLDNNDQAKDCSSPKIEEIVESQAPTKDKQKSVRFSEHVEVAQSQEDGLPAEQTFQDCDMRPQQALLTEINQDGQDVVISDHTTSAGFVFQNSFIYDLD